MRYALLLFGASLVACGPYEPPDAPTPHSNPEPVTVVVLPGDATVTYADAAPATPVALRGRWRGEWSTPTGYRCAFELELEGDVAGALTGRFRWKLLDAPPGSSQRQRIGKVATEWVRGTFDPISREIHLVGYEVDDPEMLVTDEYRLALDTAGVTFTGKSRGQAGLWRDVLRGGAVD